MANIFEADNEYRIVDVDQIYLGSPYYVEIVEPVNYKDAEIILERNGRGGFDFEYGSDDTVLEFGGSSLGLSNGKDEVMGIFNAGGTDANVKFQHYRNSTLIFEAFLIGSSEDLQDDTVSYRIKRFDLGNKFKTRFSTPIDVEANEDLDGNSITPLTLRDMSLHSKKVQLFYSGYGEDKSDVPLWLFTWDTNELNDNTATNFGYWIQSAKTNSIKELESSFDYGDVIFGKDGAVTDPEWGGAFPAATPEELEFYMLKHQSSKDAVINITWETEADIRLQLSQVGGADTWTSLQFAFSHEIRIYTESNSLKASYTKDGDTKSITSGAGPGPFDSTVTLSSTQQIEVERGDKVYCYVQINPFVAGLSVAGSNDTVQVRFQSITSSSNFIEFSALTEEIPTNCEGAYYNELLDKLLEYATGESGMLVSSIFTNRPVDGAANACAGLNFITSGYKIRQRTQNLIASIKDMLSFAETRYGCGYAIYYDSGNPKFLLEEQSFFFQDKKIMDITPNNPVVRKINKEILFNEITVGFKKFAKPNESGTSEGFSTQTEYLTPIEKDQNKATYLSDIIGDGTEIERVRRNGIQNADDESDEKDDDLFVIKVNEFSRSVKYSPSTYGSGDDLNIQRDAANDRIIVNGLIILGLDSNDYIILDGYTNRQLTGSPILDYKNNRTILPCTTETKNDTIYPNFYFAESDGSTQKRTYNPERLEGFNTITGLIDKNSVYNLDHANSQFLLHNFAWFGGGLTKKAGSSEVRFLRKKNITILSKAYDSATCGKTTSTISEDTNFTLTNLRSYDDEIFTEYLYEIKTNLSYTELVTLKEALRNESASNINYGYIEFDDNDGNAIEAFPMKVQYNPLSQECEIIAWGKNG